MNKKELVKTIAEKTETTQKAVAEVVDTLFGTVLTVVRWGFFPLIAQVQRVQVFKDRIFRLSALRKTRAIT